MHEFARLSSAVLSARFEGLLHFSGQNFAARLLNVAERVSLGIQMVLLIRARRPQLNLRTEASDIVSPRQARSCKQKSALKHATTQNALETEHLQSRVTDDRWCLLRSPSDLC